MGSYIILSRLSPEAFGDPGYFGRLAETVSVKTKIECPDVKWKYSYCTLGRYDIVDFVESDDPRQISRAAMLIRGYGHATTETLTATPWKKFLEDLK